MEMICLNGTDIHVSRLCMGGCPMGGHGWGDVSRHDLIEAVSLALDSGLNFFDTADIYGFGESEITLGEALKGCRDKAVIASKFGVRRSPEGETFYDNSSDWIETALEASLKRLNTDYIDLYQVHYRDEKTPLVKVAEILERLKKQGKIRSYGLSNIFEKDRKYLQTVNNLFSSFQNEYSLANRTHEEDILGLSRDFSLIPMTWGSLGQGILTGKYDATVCFENNDRRSRIIYKNFHGEKLVHNLKIVDKLRTIAEAHSISVSSVAIRWILDRIPHSVVIAGVKSSKQLQENMGAMGWRLSTGEIDMLDTVSPKEK